MTDWSCTEYEQWRNYTTALRALNWRPLKTEMKKSKAKIMFKISMKWVVNPSLFFHI